MFEVIEIVIACISVIIAFSVVFDIVSSKIQLTRYGRKLKIARAKHRVKAELSGWETDTSKMKRDRKTYYVVAFDFWEPLIVCCVSEEGYTIGQSCHYDVNDCVAFIELPSRNINGCKYTSGISGIDELEFVFEDMEGETG